MTMMSQDAVHLFKRRDEPMSLLDRRDPRSRDRRRRQEARPAHPGRNPVMFVVEIVALLTTVFFLRDLVTGGGAVVGMHAGFSGQIAPGCGSPSSSPISPKPSPKAAARPRPTPCGGPAAETIAKRVAGESGAIESVSAAALKQGDIVLVEAGDLIPSDGEVIEGIASVDESAITGESAPVIRESGGDRSAVTGGTRVLSDWIKVRITAAQGSTFLDRMIALVEGAERQKTPNEIALNILLAGMTIIFVFAVGDDPELRDLCRRRGLGGGAGRPVRHADPDHHRRAAVGDRHRRDGPARALQRARHVRPRRRGGWRRRHAAARQDRHDHARQPAGDASSCRCLASASRSSPMPRSSPRSPTRRPEGRSIVVLAKEKYGLRGRDMAALNAQFVPFSAQTRMSGVDIDGHADPQGRGRCRARLVGAAMAGAEQCRRRSTASRELTAIVESIAKSGGTPLAVAKDGRLLGVIHLKDIVKGGIRERFAELRQMGIRTVMITGDNPLTAAAIAAEGGRRRLPRPGDAGGRS